LQPTVAKSVKNIYFLSTNTGKCASVNKRGKKCNQYQVDIKRRNKHNEKGHKIVFNIFFTFCQAHEKEVSRLQQEIDIAREQKDIATKRVNINQFKMKYAVARLVWIGSICHGT